MAESKRERYDGHVDGLQEGNYIKAAEMKLGQRFTVKIEDIFKERMKEDSGKERGKGVLKFEGREKEYISNKTNQLRIAAMFGDAVKEWRGKRVTFEVQMVRGVSGEKVPGFRVIGSPDLTAPIEKEIQVNRRWRPEKVKLIPTQAAGATRAAQPPAPPREPVDSTELADQPPDFE